jgi:hypothetical protein
MELRIILLLLSAILAILSHRRPFDAVRDLKGVRSKDMADEVLTWTWPTTRGGQPSDPAQIADAELTDVSSADPGGKSLGFVNYDGQPKGTFTMTNPSPGTHNITLVVFGKDNTQSAKSNQFTFTVAQTAVPFDAVSDLSGTGN